VQNQDREGKAMRRFSLVVTVVVLYTSVAFATTATLVRNVNDPTNHPYQVFASTNCTLSGSCTIIFPAITAGATLVQHVSCGFSLTTSSTISTAYLGLLDLNPANLLQVFTFGSANGSTAYAINADTFLVVAKGQQPLVTIFANNPVSGLQCTLTGYYN
jgi:hypothetical protein